MGEPSGLAFGKPKGRLRDAVLRTAMVRAAGFFGIMLLSPPADDIALFLADCLSKRLVSHCF